VLEQVVLRLEQMEDRGSTIEVEVLRGIDALGTALSGMVERDAAAARMMADSLGRIADGQSAIAAALQEGASAGSMERAHEAENRMRLRSIDTQLQRIFEEIAEGRQQSTSELRADIAALTTAVRLLARSQG
jgi:division protein CdvB (Snf7/Vps24/ESCRT-III family)